MADAAHGGTDGKGQRHGHQWKKFEHKRHALADVIELVVGQKKLAGAARHGHRFDVARQGNGHQQRRWHNDR